MKTLLAFFALFSLFISCNGQPATASQHFRKQYGYFQIQPLLTVDERAAQNKVEKIKQISVDTFEAHEFLANNKEKLVYRLLKPKRYRPSVKYPLVVVLHGSAAIGEDNVRQLGIFAKSWAQDAYREKYPGFVLVPQFASRSVSYLSTGDGTITSRPMPPLKALMKLINSVKKQLNVDSKRIYIMGFSMGGSTALHALYIQPKVFAAAVVIAPVPDLSKAARIADLPLWIIHGNKDTENSFATDKLMYGRLISYGAKKVRFWELDGAAHEVPAQIFENDQIADWLFSHHK